MDEPKSNPDLLKDLVEDLTKRVDLLVEQPDVSIIRSAAFLVRHRILGALDALFYLKASNKLIIPLLYLLKHTSDIISMADKALGINPKEVLTK